MKSKTLYLFLICFYFNSASGQERIDLNKRDWKFKKDSDGNWYNASVPGCVHTDLRYDGLIEEPFYASNESKLQWIEQEDWDYQLSFEADKNILTNKNIELVFEGLDTYAKIFLNDREIGNADNMFLKWNYDVKPFLKEGKNELLVKFTSAAKEAKNLYNQLPAKLPMDERVMVRKAAYQFGWDWAPRYVTCGIWRPVYLEAWNEEKIKSIIISVAKIDSSVAELNAKISFKSGKSLNDLQNAEIIMINQNTGEKFHFKAGNIKPVNKINFPVKHPQLWWCNGLGEPYLYSFQFLLKQNNRVLDSLTISYGIRIIELVQTPDEAGRSFYFNLNGVPVFAKGANYIPQNSFPSFVDSNKYRSVVESADTLNMNMLRVWGGGIYENDWFYSLCDQKGILVWQDFMFACAMYPGNNSFVNNVRREVEYNVERLHNHPCIALWCGNNESDEGWKNWGWQRQFNYSKNDSLQIWNNYIKLFNEVIPSALKSIDSNVNYWPSSPSIGWGHPQSLKEGDSHYWGVWWGMEPFDIYKNKVGRFMSEYGFQGIPELNSLTRFIPDSGMYLFSPDLKAHQKHPKGFETIDEYMKRDFKIASDMKEYIYKSQLLQAEGMKTAIESHRRNKKYCMGTLYWQLNDCWPVVSWSGMDYFGRWKALNYFVKKAYAPMLISFDESKDSVFVYLISDRNESETNCTVELRLMDFNGQVNWQQSFAKKASNQESKRVFSISRSDLLKEGKSSQLVLNAKLKVDTSVVSENNFFFVKTKDLELPKAKLGFKFSIDPDIKNFSVEITSDKFAKNVLVELVRYETHISDNFFDLLPGEKKLIKIATNEVRGFFTKQIKLSCLNCEPLN